MKSSQRGLGQEGGRDSLSRKMTRELRSVQSEGQEQAKSLLCRHPAVQRSPWRWVACLFRFWSAPAAWQGAPPRAQRSAGSWLYEVLAVMLASRAFVGRRGQGHSEMCEALAWRDAWPAGKAEDGTEPPAPSRWLLLSWESVCPLWVFHGWFLRTLQILARTSLPPTRAKLVSANFAAPSAAAPVWLPRLLSGIPRSCTWMSVPRVCLSWFPRSPSPQGHL